MRRSFNSSIAAQADDPWAGGTAFLVLWPSDVDGDPSCPFGLWSGVCIPTCHWWHSKTGFVIYEKSVRVLKNVGPHQTKRHLPGSVRMTMSAQSKGRSRALTEQHIGLHRVVSQNIPWTRSSNIVSWKCWCMKFPMWHVLHLTRAGDTRPSGLWNKRGIPWFTETTALLRSSKEFNFCYIAGKAVHHGFFPCISGPLDSWLLARQPKFTSTELLFWGCGSWKRHWPRHSDKELPKVCPDFYFFFLIQVAVRYFSTNLWAARVTVTILPINAPELRPRRGRSSICASLGCCLWHGDHRDVLSHQCPALTPRRPALEEPCSYNLTLGLAFAVFLRISRTWVLPEEKDKSFFKFCRHRLAVMKQLDIANAEGKACAAWIINFQGKGGG